MKTGKSNDLMGKIEGSITQGSFNSSTDAKKGKGAGVSSELVGPNTKSKVAPTVDAAKKGTGAVNDIDKICRLAADHRLSVSF